MNQAQSIPYRLTHAATPIPFALTAKAATEKANMMGTSSAAHREAAAAHREAAEAMAMNKELAAKYEAKAKEHDKLADDYARDEQGRFASK